MFVQVIKQRRKLLCICPCDKGLSEGNDYIIVQVKKERWKLLYICPGYEGEKEIIIYVTRR